MADANIVITGVTLMPNPVNTGGQYVLAVEIKPVIFAIADADGIFLADSDGKIINTEE
ncbi:MAG: hypothetical protein Q4C61_16245 [Lachnospiraceae bacterium]|nr:hypothetical protein [Lachnospiraceae bacterium]